MSIILRALRDASSMIEIERATFVDCHTLPSGGLEPDDKEILKDYDDVLALIRDAVEAAEIGVVFCHGCQWRGLTARGVRQWQRGAR